jgi:tetratricopeptide (TPR) repeat protein
MLWNCTNKFLLALCAVYLAGCFGGGLRQDVAIQGEQEQVHAPVPASVQREYTAAIEHMNANEDDAAAAQLEQFIAANPDYPGAYVNLAIIYARQNRTDEAIWLLNRALQANPESVQALNRLGLVNRQQGQFDEAEAAWLAAISADPEYAYAWYNLGVLYDLYLQDLPAALDHYRQYQRVAGEAEQDEVVSRWIADLERRLGTPAQAAQARED